MKKQSFNIPIKSLLDENDLDFNISINIDDSKSKKEDINQKINIYERPNTRVCRQQLSKRKLF